MTKKQTKIKKFRKHIERSYRNTPMPFEYKGGFDELLCYELHGQPINPRMNHKTLNDGYCMGLTFRELAKKWGISITFLGELIADHCKELEPLFKDREKFYNC